MKIEEACHAILGDEAAHAIITEQGVLWCVVAAMAAATTEDDPTAIATIRQWNKASGEVPYNRGFVS